MSDLSQFGLNSVERVKNACTALKAGQGVILVDDEDRENEGDLIFSTEYLSENQVTQMINDCSGIICLCITTKKAQELGLPMMVSKNTSRYQTAFTTSIEAKIGVTTGVSAQDRLVTIKTAMDEKSKAFDLVQPGHIFPIVAESGGVLSRRGHTEGSVDLMKIANLNHSAVLCELMNKNGTMKKMPELLEYASAYDLIILSVEDIYNYLCSDKGGLLVA